MHVGAVRDDLPHHGRVPGPGGRHQGRLPAERFLQVGIRAVLEQQAHHVHAAGARRGHQRCLAGREDIRVGAGAEQGLHRARAPVGAGQQQRRRAVAVRRVGVRPGAQQQAHQLQVVVVDRPVQRRRAVGCAGARVDAVRQQRLDGPRVAPLRGVDQRDVGVARQGAAGGEQQHADAQSAAESASHDRSSCVPRERAARLRRATDPQAARSRPVASLSSSAGTPIRSSTLSSPRVIAGRSV